MEGAKVSWRMQSRTLKCTKMQMKICPFNTDSIVFPYTPSPICRMCTWMQYKRLYLRMLNTLKHQAFDLILTSWGSSEMSLGTVHLRYYKLCKKLCKYKVRFEILTVQQSGYSVVVTTANLTFPLFAYALQESLLFCFLHDLPLHSNFYAVIQSVTYGHLRYYLVGVQD